MNPLISVIIPVYNTSLPVRRLLAVLFKQTYPHLEIICVDDGSTDDSLSQLKKLRHTDSRLKVLHQKNAGASSARNLGLDHAGGDLISFLDSDDLVTLDYYELMLKSLHSSAQKTTTDNNISDTYAFSVCGFHYFRLNTNSQSDVFVSPLPKQKTGELARAYLLRLMNEDGRLYSSVNKLYHASIIRDNHLRFDVSKDFAEDTKFVFDYLDAWLKTQGETPEKLQHRIKIATVLKPLYLYNFGTETSTVKRSSLIWKNWEDSLKDLTIFAEPLPRKQSQKLIQKLRRRFKVSRALAVARTSLPRQEKLRYLSGFQLAIASLIVKFRP